MNPAPSAPVPYWLCCGSLDPAHRDDDARRCIEAKRGHPEHCRFGTAEEHSAHQLAAVARQGQR